MEQKNAITKINSVQLNIVTFVDVNKAVRNQSLENALYIMDNSPTSIRQGSPCLQTVCKQGQVLNWIIYPMDMNKRTDGTWPPFVKINNIVFLEGESENASVSSIMDSLKIYGGPDRMRSIYTPVYYYWAGIIPLDLSPGIYRYRLILELETGEKDKCIYLNLETPSLKVIPVI